jgi:hypothetical protein
MIRVTIEVRTEATPSSVTVQAQSIQRAASIAAARYPNAEVRVRFPIDPEGFSVDEPAEGAGIVSIEKPEAIAA